MIEQVEQEWFEGCSVEPAPIDYSPWWLKAAIEVLCFACFGALLALALRA